MVNEAIRTLGANLAIAGLFAIDETHRGTVWMGIGLLEIFPDMVVPLHSPSTAGRWAEVARCRMTFGYCTCGCHRGSGG